MISETNALPILSEMYRLALNGGGYLDITELMDSALISDSPAGISRDEYVAIVTAVFHACLKVIEERHSYREKSEFVYFLRCNATGNIKIGTTTDIETRIKTLNTSSPNGVSVVAIISGGRELEKSLHNRFRKHSIHGEWYCSNDELEEFVSSLPFHGHLAEEDRSS